MTAKKEMIELGEAPYSRGDRVEITEEGIRPWPGMVTAVKPSFVSGWWIDVVRDFDNMVWSICVANVSVRELPRQEG